MYFKEDSYIQNYYLQTYYQRKSRLCSRRCNSIHFFFFFFAFLDIDKFERTRLNVLLLFDIK